MSSFGTEEPMHTVLDCALKVLKLSDQHQPDAFKQFGHWLFALPAVFLMFSEMFGNNFVSDLVS